MPYYTVRDTNSKLYTVYVALRESSLNKGKYALAAGSRMLYDILGLRQKRVNQENSKK